MSAREPQPIRVVLLGAGGHARSVLEALRGSPIVPAACTDPRPALHGETLDGIPIAGDDGELAALRAGGVEGAIVAVGSLGDSRLREELFARAADAGYAFPVVRAPSTVVSERARIGPGSGVLANAVVGPGADVGTNVIVHTSAVVEHDVVVGDHAHVATGALLGGGAVVGAGAHIGLGAVVREGIAIGARSVVGAGAVVVRDVRPGVTVVGVPARERNGT